MIVYADSSVLVAWFHPEDQFALLVTRWAREQVTDFLWNPVLRLEVRHNLRKIKGAYARTAWNALRAAERGRLRMGRVRLHEIIEDADELSAQRAASVPAGSWDFVHVAAALQARAACFATCDQLQADLADASGFSGNRLKLFKA